jgi:hypothetical protein
MAEPSEKGKGLALVFGAPEKGAGKTEEGEASGDFESAAVDAFPELEGKPERIAALKQAIMACMDAGESGEYDEEP